MWVPTEKTMTNQPINPHLVSLFLEGHKTIYQSDSKISYNHLDGHYSCLELVTGRRYPQGEPIVTPGPEFLQYQTCHVRGSPQRVCVICLAKNGIPNSVLGLEEEWVKLTNLGHMYFIGVKHGDPDTEYLVDFAGRCGPKTTDVARPRMT